jgi:hypothetical protein
MGANRNELEWQKAKQPLRNAEWTQVEVRSWRCQPQPQIRSSRPAPQTRTTGVIIDSYQDNVMQAPDFDGQL